MMDGSSGWQPSQESRIRLKRRSLALNNHWELHFGENRVHRLPSNHCHPRETDPGFESLASSYLWQHLKLSQFVSWRVMFFWPGYRQTNRQTNFYFVRPFFQSRERESMKPVWHNSIQRQHILNTWQWNMWLRAIWIIQIYMIQI